MTAPRIDAAALKQAATGKWPDILQRFGGIPAESLDGRHCACPKCGGTDRFRMIDPERGAVFCNQCFNKDNGDGLAALQWAKGCDFPTALRAVAEHLGMGDQTNGHTAGNGKVNGKKPDDLRAKVEWSTPKPPAALLAEWCESKPPIKAEAPTAYGVEPCTWPKRNGAACLAFTGRSIEGDEARPAALLLYRADGQEFLATEKLSARKTHLLGGSKESWLWPGSLAGLRGRDRREM